MIQPNRTMRRLLQQYRIDVNDVPVNHAYPIWKKRDQEG